MASDKKEVAGPVWGPGASIRRPTLRLLGVDEGFGSHVAVEGAVGRDESLVIALGFGEEVMNSLGARELVAATNGRWA